MPRFCLLRHNQDWIKRCMNDGHCAVTHKAGQDVWGAAGEMECGTVRKGVDPMLWFTYIFRLALAVGVSMLPATVGVLAQPAASAAEATFVVA